MSIIQASDIGDIDDVIELIDKGINVNVKNKKGNTALIVACKNGYLDIVKELLKAGANPNIQNQSKETALIVASSGDSREIVGELINAGVDLNNFDYTALMKACTSHKITILKELIKAGANLNIQNKHGETALMIAIDSRGYNYGIEYTLELIKAGTNLNIQDKQGNTALIKACKRKNIVIVKELLRNGADLYKKNYYGEDPIYFSEGNEPLKKYLEKVDLALKMLMATVYKKEEIIKIYQQI